MPRPLFFWEKMQSMHMAPLLKALCDRGHSVTWLTDLELDPLRAAQGWSLPDTSGIQTRLVQPGDVDAILAQAPANTLHVIAPRGSATGPALARASRRSAHRFAILAERPSGQGLAIALRKLVYRRYAHTLRNVDFVFAMGERGRLFYDDCGFRNVHAFGYCIDHHYVAPRFPDGPYHVIAVAQLIRRKGLDLLLRAMPAESCWQMTIVGRGPKGAGLRALARKRGIEDRLQWIDSLPNVDTRSLVGQADTLVLPSRWDGWGVVVNEAIAAGTRVIVSFGAGAACLEALSDAVIVVPTGDTAALRTALLNEIRRGPVQPAERLERAHEHTRIGPEAMAVYLGRIISGEKTVPPWDVSLAEEEAKRPAKSRRR